MALITSPKSFFLGFFSATLMGVTFLMANRERVFLTLVQDDIFTMGGGSRGLQLRGNNYPEEIHPNNHDDNRMRRDQVLLVGQSGIELNDGIQAQPISKGQFQDTAVFPKEESSSEDEDLDDEEDGDDSESESKDPSVHYDHESRYDMNSEDEEDKSEVETNESEDKVDAVDQNSVETIKAGDVFAPGSLSLSTLETYKKCYVDPCRYKQHFRPRGSMCDISEPHKLVYFLSAKCGSSTGRATMQQYFNATERSCQQSHFAEPTSEYTRLAFSREPFSRFFAGYQQALKNMLSGKKKPEIKQPPRNIPAKYVPSFYDSFQNFTGMNEIRESGDEILVNALQQFVRDYSGDIPFDAHLVLQVPFFFDKDTGRLRELDALLDTKQMTQAFEDYADSFGVPKPRPLTANQRQISLTDEGLTKADRQKICQVSAIDYCCLNYELPEECKDAVQCQWTERPEYPGELLIEPVSPYPPADQC